MKMKHTCGICGYQSKDFDEVQRCRNQGSPNEHSVDEVIAFRAPITGVILKGKIKEIAFKRRSHEVLYTVAGAFGVTNVSESDIQAKQSA